MCPTECPQSRNRGRYSDGEHLQLVSCVTLIMDRQTDRSESMTSFSFIGGGITLHVLSCYREIENHVDLQTAAKSTHHWYQPEVSRLDFNY